MNKTLEPAITLHPPALRRGVMSWIRDGERKDSLCESSESLLQPDKENLRSPRKKILTLPESRHASRRMACAGWLVRRAGRATVAVLGLAIGVVALGCHSGQNPSVDPYPHATKVTTASVDAARAAEPHRVEQHRDYERAEARAADGAVMHGPLYFEDPLEETISDDGRFAWSGSDYFYWLYGPAMYFIDVALAPVSVLVTPPWQATVSDGNAERRFLTPGINDAKPRPKAPVSPSTPPETGSTSG